MTSALSLSLTRKIYSKTNSYTNRRNIVEDSLGNGVPDKRFSSSRCFRVLDPKDVTAPSANKKNLISAPLFVGARRFSLLSDNGVTQPGGHLPTLPRQEERVDRAGKWEKNGGRWYTPGLCSIFLSLKVDLARERWTLFRGRLHQPTSFFLLLCLSSYSLFPPSPIFSLSLFLFSPQTFLSLYRVLCPISSSLHKYISAWQTPPLNLTTRVLVAFVLRPYTS